jgi:hypothetical protein
MTEVSIVGDGRRVSATSIEMSAGGLSVQSAEEFSSGTNIEVSFALMTLPRVNVRGAVTWRKSKKFGVQFDPPTTGARKSGLGSIPTSTTEPPKSKSWEPKRIRARNTDLREALRSSPGIARSKVLTSVPFAIRKRRFQRWFSANSAVKSFQSQRSLRATAENAEEGSPRT